MVPTKPFTSDPAEMPVRQRPTIFLAPRPGFYTVLVCFAALCAGTYSLRDNGIFSCSASGYGADRYLGYCGGTSYGDYDHGAMWFDLEPAAGAAAASAQVIFLGSSRTEFGFSSKVTDKWFSSVPASYYLLGFSHFENYSFEKPLLHRLEPRAKVYVINIDSFFDQSETGPGRTVMHDESAQNRYRQKRQWQTIHKAVCTAVRGVCGNELAIFRSPSTGAWVATGDKFTSAPVSYDDNVNAEKVTSYARLGREFLSNTPMSRACTVFTIVPAVGTEVGTAKAVGAALGQNVVAPKPEGLMTFDGFHLNPDSAERWSAAFFEEAGPRIRKCLSE